MRGEIFDIHRPWTIDDDIEFMRRVGVSEKELAKYRKEHVSK